MRVREPDWFKHRLFKGPDTYINLYVFGVGASEAERMLRFVIGCGEIVSTGTAARGPSEAWFSVSGGTYRIMRRIRLR
jgi:hypothetical protein